MNMLEMLRRNDDENLPLVRLFIRQMLHFLSGPEFYPLPLGDFNLLLSPDVPAESGFFIHDFEASKAPDLNLLVFGQSLLERFKNRLHD